jgi:hypothetical protein
MWNLPEIEAAIAAEAAAHSEAAAALNPYGEAEAMAIGRGRLIYSGVISSVHGVFGLGLDGPPEDRDWAEIERFFTRKDRPAAFWVTPFTDSTVMDVIKHTHRPARTIAVRGEKLAPSPLEADPHLSGPDLSLWSQAFGESEAYTKLHQSDTRYFLSGGGASYTFFHNGYALVPHPSAETLALQKKESFHSRAIIVMGEADLPLLYERILHEPI